MQEDSAYLKMTGITKEFPGVVALNNVDFSVKLGKVTALVGENGAGKSTLIKILAGIHRKDSGEILIEGVSANIENPLDAMKCGISVIHQELNVLDNLSIMENVFVGKEHKKRFFIDKKYCYDQTRRFLDSVGMNNMDPEIQVRYLSTAQKQMVEIIRAISWQSKIVVMDEPTSSLTQKETNILFGIIRSLKDQNVGIVYISHRMEEIMDLADDVIILRDGRLVGNLEKTMITQEKVINMMVGRKLDDLFPKFNTEIGDVVLEVRDLNQGYLRNISFAVHAGEILGFSGLVGAGRSEVMRIIFGIDKKDSGEIFIDGNPVEINHPQEAIHYGIALVPEDRKTQALIMSMVIRENITLAILDTLRERLFFSKKKELKVSNDYVKALGIVTPSVEQVVKNLSGGNQQKVVLAKWMAAKPRVLILDEPTRGIDVGAKREIHELISKMAQLGVAVIMISSEMPEILGMSDRIVVMHEGHIKGELTRAEADQEKIMNMAIS
ncbi:MAG: sugar ABC transporter ATP-binding protein [Treponema sp.]|nr:sugar ABC transporter ATP-binding protein [Treponema sp.]